MFAFVGNENEKKIAFIRNEMNFIWICLIEICLFIYNTHEWVGNRLGFWLGDILSNNFMHEIILLNFNFYRSILEFSRISCT